MPRLNKELQKELEPKRIVYAKQELGKLGLEIVHETDTYLSFLFKGELIKLYPYSGWHTGKGIVDGRGIENLLKQLKA